MTWIERRTKSVMTVHRGTRRYRAIVKPEPDPAYGSDGYGWKVYRLTREITAGWNADDYHARLEAEQALLALMETDRTAGDTA